MGFPKCLPIMDPPPSGRGQLVGAREAGDPYRRLAAPLCQAVTNARQAGEACRSVDPLSAWA